jgi:hypothetical protein
MAGATIAELADRLKTEAPRKRVHAAVELPRGGILELPPPARDIGSNPRAPDGQWQWQLYGRGKAGSVAVRRAPLRALDEHHHPLDSV